MEKTSRKQAVLLLVGTIIFTLMSGSRTQTVRAATPDFLIAGQLNGLVDGKITLENEYSFDLDKVIELNEDMMQHYFGGDPFKIYSGRRDNEYLLDHLHCDESGLCADTIGDSREALGDALQIIIVFDPDTAQEKRFSSEFIDIAADIARRGEVYDIEPVRVYNGKAQTQSVLVFYNSMEIEQGKEYQVTYKNNINAGEAQVIIKGTGNYVGQIIKTFKIEKAANPLTAKAKTASVKYSKLKKKAQTLSVSKVITISKKGQGTVTYKKLSGNKKIKINSKTGKVTVKKGLKKGSYKVKVKITAAGNSNYKSATNTVKFKIRVK